MRGIATVIVVAFIAVIMFALVAPAIVEPVAEVVLADQAVQDSVIDGDGIVDNMLSSLLVWVPLFVMGSGVVSAVVWYFRKERVSARRVR